MARIRLQRVRTEPSKRAGKRGKDDVESSGISTVGDLMSGTPGVSPKLLTWRHALIGVFLLAGLWFFLHSLRAVLTPIFLSLVIAYLLDPVVDRFEVRGWSRSSAIGVLLVFFFGVSVLLILALVPMFHTQMEEVASKFPEYRTAVEKFFSSPLTPWLERWLGVEPGVAGVSLWSELTDKARQAIPNLSGILGTTVGSLFGNVLSAGLFLVSTLLIPVFAFYFLRDWDRMVAAVHQLIPTRRQEQVREVASEINKVLGAFVRGQLVVCMILVALYSLGLAFFGAPMWLVIGVFSGVGFLIPYVGTALGMTLAGVLTAFHYGWDPVWTGFPVPRVLCVVGWFAVVQIIESYAITPRIIGEKVGLHPVAIIVAIIAGGQILGFLGMLLAVPMAAAGAVLIRGGLGAYLRSQFYLQQWEGLLVFP